MKHDFITTNKIKSELKIHKRLGDVYTCSATAENKQKAKNVPIKNRSHIKLFT